MFRNLMAIASLLFCLMLAGCVTAVDEQLPYTELPMATVAIEFNLVASPAHPTAYLSPQKIPAGSEVQIIGTDTNAAWLLILYQNMMGWMSTVLSTSNLGTLQPAVTIDPLSDRCTRYIGATFAEDEVWTSSVDGSLIVHGSIYRPEAVEDFAEATLTLEIDGQGNVAVADYVHTPLTASSALVLFAFSLSDIQEDSQIQFSLAGAGDEPLYFQAAFYVDDCPPSEVADDAFTTELPIGQIRIPEPKPATNATSAQPASSAINVGMDGRGLSQSVPLTVTLFVPPGISGSHSFTLPLLLDMQTSPQPPTDLIRSGGASVRQPIPLVINLTDILESSATETIELPLRINVQIDLLNRDSSTGSESGSATGDNTAPSGASGDSPRQATTITHSSSAPLGPTEVCGDIAEDTVWEAVRSPYLVTCSITVLPNATLTVEAGTVVKFDRGTLLHVDDTLIVQGTAENPVYFTALNDDTVSGDSNGDGSESTPEVQHWVGIRFAPRSNDDSLIEHLMIRYTGSWSTGAIILENASPALRNITFEENYISGAHIGVETLETDTWDNTDVVYVVGSSVSVAADQLLTVVPGMIVKFARGTLLHVDDTLIIEGTAENPVYFTALTDDSVGGDTNGDGSTNLPSPQHWVGIRFAPRSDDEDSLIEHLAIRYTGSWSTGAIILDNASPTLRAITFEDNYIGGVYIGTENLETDTWDNTEVVYVVGSNLTVAPDQVLTIVPGMIIKFARGTLLHVDDTLIVQGTSEAPVYFTALTDDSVGGDTNGDGSANLPSSQHWVGIRFAARSNDENSLIENLVIRYTGSWSTGPVILDNASPTLHAITFEDNYISGAYIGVENLETDTWDNTDVVYVVGSNVTVAADQTLTVAPGMIIKFARGTLLHVDDTLIVEGTAEAPVYFTALTDDSIGGDTNGDGSESLPQAQHWVGVRFSERSNDANSIIDYLVIRYTGSWSTGTIILENAAPTLQNITFEYNYLDDVEVAE